MMIEIEADLVGKTMNFAWKRWSIIVNENQIDVGCSTEKGFFG